MVSPTTGLIERTSLHARLRQQPADHRVGRAPDAQRAGEQDRRLELAELGHLRHAEQLAEAVADVDGGGDAVEKDVAGMGQDGGDAGPDRVADANRGLADAHAGDVGDRVQRTRREGAGDDAEVAGARGALGAQGARDEKAEEGKRGSHLTRMPTVESQCSGFDARGSGLSGTWPTDTPYFQSGGQMAMNRAYPPRPP